MSCSSLSSQCCTDRVLLDEETFKGLFVYRVASPHHGSEPSVACLRAASVSSLPAPWEAFGPDDGRPWLPCQLSEFSEPLSRPCSNYSQSTQVTYLGTHQKAESCLLRSLWLCKSDLSSWSHPLLAYFQKQKKSLWCCELSDLLGRTLFSRQFDCSCQRGGEVMDSEAWSRVGQPRFLCPEVSGCSKHRVWSQTFSNVSFNLVVQVLGC